MAENADIHRSIMVDRHASRSGLASGPSQAWAKQVALFTGMETPATDDLTRILRTRLRFLAVITVVAYAYFALAIATSKHGYHISQYDHVEWVFCLLVHGTLAWEAALTYLLWRKGQMSLAQLRLVELGVLALPLVYQWCSQLAVCWLDHDFWRNLVDEGDPRGTARAQVLPWLVLIITYGIVIPNSWRRCLLMVGIIGALACVVNLGSAWIAPALNQPAAWRYLGELGVWVLLSIALAVFNAARVDTLRSSAAAARKLGQYHLGRRLGAGGMGEVYFAEHAMLRRPCALKLIRPEHAADPAALKRFEREVRTTSTLTHPNTVQVFDYGRTDEGVFYYVMEYLPGLPLDELVRLHGPLVPARAVYLLRQVCGALTEAHGVGLIHRDLKPGNVIVCSRGGVADCAKLLDFGLVMDHQAGANAQLTQAGMAVGTPAYISPEQATGNGPVDGRSDLYSLGALAYYLLTGRVPFERDSPLQVLVAHLHDPPPPLRDYHPGLSPALEAVVLRCLAKNPNDRYQSAADLDAALAACDDIGQWDQAQASAWWHANPLPPAPAPDVTPA